VAHFKRSTRAILTTKVSLFSFLYIHLEKDIAKEARKIIDQIDLIDRGYFGKDRKKQIKTMMDETLALLDTKPIDLIKNKKEKADMLYLRGKCLDYNPEYTK
jgi:hypothetical protein